MVHTELGHREMLGVAGRQARLHPDCSCGNQAIRLSECDSGSGKITTPHTGPPAIRQTKWSNAEALDQVPCQLHFVATQSAEYLFYVDRTRPCLITALAKLM